MIKTQFDLSGRVALVVGGRGLLGRRFADTLDEFGAQVYSADLTTTSHAARGQSGYVPAANVIQRDVDVMDPVSVTQLFNGVMSESKRLDTLIFSVTAKPDDFYKPFTESSLEGWRKILGAELDGLFLSAQQAGRVMEPARRGSIVFISSIYGIVGNDQRIYADSNLPALYAGLGAELPTRIYAHAGYAAAKGAVISMTRFLAAYWGEHGIRVNCISPGGIAHPGENEAFVRRYSERVPLGRKAGLDEISSAVAYLASDASSYVTGHNLVVDGGWTAW